MFVKNYANSNTNFRYQAPPPKLAFYHNNLGKTIQTEKATLLCLSSMVCFLTFECDFLKRNLHKK